MSRLSPRAVPAKRPPNRPQVPRETFGMLRLRSFRLTIYCDPCKEVHFVNLVERPDLEDVPVGSVDFQCQQCKRLGHYRLTPPFRGEKPRLFEQASSCRGPADYDPTPFVGPFPLLTTTGDYLIGDFAALGFCLLATCPGGRERLIDPRDATWHHLHGRSLAGARLRCEGCRARIHVTVVPPWYRRRGFAVVRAMTALDVAAVPTEPSRGA
ncbi:hypothetical protein SAMN02990966_02856 [Rhodospirillales bacterium URHD0017]|nr:hypothetical protein SAMN02990966_02856 [Rhodospirillales bacterium URHD0017]